SARASLRTMVWSLRSATGPDAVLATRSAVGLQPEAWWIDVHEVDALGGRGELTAALALCRGELFADFTDDWAEQARIEHRARRAALLDALAERVEAAGDLTEAAPLSRQRCALTPPGD